MIVRNNQKKLKLENFEGPLDLLLHMIRSKKMDILEISLIEIADHYIEFVYSQETIDLDETSDYLLLASQLIDIKTKSLLKTDIFLDRDLYEDEKEDILERLIVYEKFKNLAKDMGEAYNEASRFEKLDDDFVPYLESEGERIIKLVSKGKKDLEKAIRNIMLRVENNSVKETVVRVTRLSTEQIKTQVEEMLKMGDTTFTSLLIQETHYYISLVLLILLEMSKNNEVFLIQKEDYSDIEVRRINYGK